MAYKVFKKGKKFAIVTDTNQWWSKEYWLVDVSTGQKLDYWWDTGTAKWYMEQLESGGMSASSFSDHGIMDHSVMPKSLQQMQKKLQNPTPAKAAPKNPPKAKAYAPSSDQVWGAQVTKDHGTFQTLKLADGSYGWQLKSGESMAGYKSPSGATLAGKKALEDKMKLKAAELGVDPGQSATDAMVAHYRDRVSAMYSQAVADMRAKQARAMEAYESKRQDWEARVSSGAATKEQFDEWLRNQSTLQGAMLGMTEQLSQALTDADAHAMTILNGYVPSAYAENFNYATYQVESGAEVATSFTLYDSSTVARLMAKDRQLLPETGTEKEKDLAWNRRKVTEAVTQGILQGESVPKVAARLEAVANMDKRAALRNARTALTAAQNAGRTDAYARAKAMGIDLVQEWQATYDARTRHSHAAMDGERAEVGEKFSNGLRYPADPKGAPSEVYNCRCTLVPVLGGLDDGGEWRKDIKIGDMSYEEWKEWHADRATSREERVAALLDRCKADVASKKAEIADLDAQMSALSSKMGVGKSYEGIWKDPVTLDDWPAKKDAVQAKLDYFDKKVAHYEKMGIQNAVDDFKQKIADTKEFDELGRLKAEGRLSDPATKAKLAELTAKRDAARDQLTKLLERQKGLESALADLRGRVEYSQERKDAAYAWSSKVEADKVMRPWASDAWLSASRAQRDAIWDYTSGSGKFNRPLSGFEGSWGTYAFNGAKGADLNFEGAESQIRRMTEYLQGSETRADVWLRRGCGTEAIEPFLGLDYGAMASMSEEDLKAYVGHSNRILSFLSCGTAAESGAGFGGQVDMRIFVPEGTQAAYAEPFSAYSGASYNGRRWDGRQQQGDSEWDFGHEDETIIQRGASYTLTDIRREGYTWKVELEVHPEDGYDLFGQEEHWSGAGR